MPSALLPALLTRLTGLSRLWVPALALAAFAAGWQTNGWRWEAREAAGLQASLDSRLKAEQSAARLAERAEADRAAIERHAREISRRREDETRKAEYRCAVPPGGVLLLDAARSGVDAPGGADRALP